MNTLVHVPPGFRFHPTDEELVDYYLRKKVASKKIDLDVIKDVDLYKIEPWDLQELCRIGTEEQHEWYFFSHKDKKYPTGTRTNRATKAGFWKATGRDKTIYTRHTLIGMRKTLVFYKGRAPNGQKSDWIMHEYRLETIENAPPQEEGWVVCRVFKKRLPTMRKLGDYDSPPFWYDEPGPYTTPEIDSPMGIGYYPQCYPQWSFQSAYAPQFENPNMPGFGAAFPFGSGSQDECMVQHGHVISNQSLENVTDWRVLDKFVASQLSNEGEGSKGENCVNSGALHGPEVSDEEVKRLVIAEDFAAITATWTHGSSL